MSGTSETDALLEKLNSAVRAADEAEQNVETARTEFVSRSKAVGLLLLEAQKLHPKVKDFKAYLAKVDGLKLSRVYDLLKLAGGRATEEELRKEAAERQRRKRERDRLPSPAEPSERFRDVTENSQPATPEVRRIAGNDVDPAVSAEKRKAFFTSPEERSSWHLAHFVAACNAHLPGITFDAHKEAARKLVAELTRKAAA
jgi:hypothetical protein